MCPCVLSFKVKVESVGAMPTGVFGSFVEYGDVLVYSVVIGTGG